MELTKEIINLCASILIFLGSMIALISSIGLVKFQDVFLEAMPQLKVLHCQCY